MKAGKDQQTIIVKWWGVLYLKAVYYLKQSKSFGG